MKKLFSISVLISIVYLAVGQDNGIQKTPRYQHQESQVSLFVAEGIDDLHIVRNESSYYKEQALAWKIEVKKNPDDPAIWYNYYKATRYAHTNQATGLLSSEGRELLDAIVKDMAEKVSESYEYNYILYWNSNYDNRSYGKNLLSAYELAPKKTEIYDDLVAYYEIEGNQKKKKEICSLWYNSGMIDQSVLDYNYNVLMSLKEDAILFTNGINDTYPIWMLQLLQGVRTDVKVVSIPLLENREYKNRLFASLGIKNPPVVTMKFASSHSDNDIPKIIQNNGDKPIYLGLTVNPEWIKPLKKDLYVTGLAMRYSEVAFDNLSEIQQNWGRKFKLHELKRVENGHLQSNLASRQLDANYLIPMLLLYDSYNKSGLSANALELSTLANRIAKGSSREATVSEYLAKK